MDTSLPGVMQTLAVAVRQFQISSRACRGFCPACLQQCKNFLELVQRHAGQKKDRHYILGVMHSMTVPVPQFNMNSGLFSL